MLNQIIDTLHKNKCKNNLKNNQNLLFIHHIRLKVNLVILIKIVIAFRKILQKNMLIMKVFYTIVIIIKSTFYQYKKLLFKLYPFQIQSLKSHYQMKLLDQSQSF